MLWQQLAARTSATLLKPALCSRTLSLTARRAQMAEPPAYSSWRLDPPHANKGHAALYANQNALPKLPVPALDSTLDRLLVNAKAIAKEGEWLELERKVRAFRESGVAQKLQARLEARAKDP
jgi:carnitine O-acetyltransferase